MYDSLKAKADSYLKPRVNKPKLMGKAGAKSAALGNVMIKTMKTRPMPSVKKTMKSL